MRKFVAGNNDNISFSVLFAWEIPHYTWYTASNYKVICKFCILNVRLIIWHHWQIYQCLWNATPLFTSSSLSLSKFPWNNIVVVDDFIFNLYHWFWIYVNGSKEFHFKNFPHGMLFFHFDFRDGSLIWCSKCIDTSIPFNALTF